jgi:DNA-binding transcriptional MocR family regulator
MTLPLYVQLADKLALPLQRGILLPGERMPSVRETSLCHALSRNTVVAAYGLLEDRGLIEARPQSGFFVRPSLPAPQNLNPALAAASCTTPSSVLDLIGSVLQAQAHSDYIDLGLACPRGSEFYPVVKLGRILRQLLRRHPLMISTYALPPGSPRLRKQIARRGMQLGMALDPDAIVLTHGCLEAIQLALRAVTRPGDTVGLESPTYFNLLPLLAGLGLKVVEIPTDPSHGLAVDAVEALLSAGSLQAIVAMPTIHNPLGCCMPLAAKQRLAQLVNRYQVPLIEDALYAELQFSPQLSPTVKAFDQDGWVIICASYTKTLAPDFRIGWMEGGRYTEAIKRLKFTSSVAESEVLAEAVGLFLESGGYDHHLRALRRRYAKQVAQVRSQIALHFPPGTRATSPVGGFLIWLELPGKIDAEQLFQRALSEKICIIPGLLSSPSGRFRHALRLSCCYPLDARYLEALARLGQLARQMAAPE